MMLAADYEKSIGKKKIVVFVRDNETRRLASRGRSTRSVGKSLGKTWNCEFTWT